MHSQIKVLHLSLALAMALSPLAISADSSETMPGSVGTNNPGGEQVASGKGQAQQFKNAGESNRLRHRVNEAEKDKATRKRLEKHEGEEDGDGSQDQDQDQLQERERKMEQSRSDDQDQEMDQDRVRDQARTRDHQLDPYAFENGPAGQDFSDDVSMYQIMSGGSASGNGRSSTASRSAGGTRRGPGGR